MNEPGAKRKISPERKFKMKTTTSRHAIDRVKAVGAIMQVRHEWEEAAQGDSLLQVNGCVGYLLADVAAGLGLSNEELQLALGPIADDLKHV